MARQIVHQWKDRILNFKFSKISIFRQFFVCVNRGEGLCIPKGRCARRMPSSRVDLNKFSIHPLSPLLRAF